MGVFLMGMAKSRRVMAVAITGLALFAASAPWASTARPASAASCADLELQPAGALTVSGCGVSRLRGIPAASSNEAHFASGTTRTGSASEAQQPRANAHFGRAGRIAATTTGAAAASISALPPRKTIDLSQLPAALVAPAE